MPDAGQSAPSSWLVKAVAFLAAAFWTHYLLVHDILGLLTVDEIYFTHVLWLMREGLQPYADFYSAHLPAYFEILGAFIPAAPSLDLSFVWGLRALSAVIVAIYLILLLKLCRRDFLFLLPVLLVFITFGRVVEIRPDTFGLLLFNLGWWQLLRGTERKNILLAAAFSSLALFFSARASVMILGMGVVCALLCVQRKDARTFAYLVLMAVGLAAIVAFAYALDPDRFALIVKSVYLDPASLMPDLTIKQRVLATDRLILVALIVVAIAGAGLGICRGTQMARQRDRRRPVAVPICLWLVDAADPCRHRPARPLFDSRPLRWPSSRCERAGVGLRLAVGHRCGGERPAGASGVDVADHL